MQHVMTLIQAKEHPESYKECEQISLGSTDISALLFRPCNGAPKEISCSYDGFHKAYLIPWDSLSIPLPEHYEEVLRCQNWLKVYDDDSLTAELWGDWITVYRAGGTFAIRITHQ